MPRKKTPPSQAADSQGLIAARKSIIAAWCTEFGVTATQLLSRRMEEWSKKAALLAYLLHEVTVAGASDLQRLLACSEREASLLLNEAAGMLTDNDKWFVQHYSSIKKSLEETAEPDHGESQQDEQTFDPLTFPIRNIASAVARVADVDLRDMRAPGRSTDLLLPRQVSIYLICCMTDASLPEIGRYFKRHHTAVLEARRKVHAVAQGEKTDVPILELLRASCQALGVEMSTLWPRNMTKD